MRFRIMVLAQCWALDRVFGFGLFGIVRKCVANHIVSKCVVVLKPSLVIPLIHCRSVLAGFVISLHELRNCVFYGLADLNNTWLETQKHMHECIIDWQKRRVKL